MRTSTALLSLVSLLATSATAATLPYRYSQAVARGEQVLTNSTASFSERGSQPAKRMVRRRKPCPQPGTQTPPPPPTSLAGNQTGGNTGNVPESEWKLWKTIAGDSFFNEENWMFWNYDDPTHGEVEYVDKNTAQSAGLFEVDAQGNAIMRVETTQQTGKRKSIRLHSSFEFNGGLVLMDATHMPVGCATWPAWWENGPDWPTGGEIDILEGVNDGQFNQVSLHTAPGCRIPQDAESHMTGKLKLGNYDAHSCSQIETGNQGCGVMSDDPGTYGEGFNNQQGGVYALAWDKNGISAWFHPRSKIPADITADKPNPANWGTPFAFYSSEMCDPFKYFYNHISIFDTTLCGDWAGSDDVWRNGGCAAKTGFDKCVDFVHARGDAFKNAYWSVSYVKYYSSPASQKP